MICTIAVWGALAGLSLAAVAGEYMVVSNCDDITAWQGGVLETETVYEGSGAVSWTPSQSLSLSTEQIPHDWSSGTGLSFWMHSTKATGSRFWLILDSQDPEKEGPDYYLFSTRVDWEGWRQFTLPFEELAAIRSPVGWHSIDSVQLHAAWDREAEPLAEDVWLIDDIRIVNLLPAGRGPRMTDAEFFAALDLDLPGLEAVKNRTEAEDWPAAKAAFREYFLARRDVRWFDNWWERPPLPQKRPSTTRADETLDHIYNFDRGRYELGPDIDWNSNQRDEGEAATIEWNAALNRHFFLKYLADAYQGTLEDRYPAEIVAMMLSWIEDSPLLLIRSGNSPYHYAWETLNTAVRGGDTWIDAIWRTADAPAWTPDALCTVLKSLVEHARHLMKWPSRGNWLTAESKAITIIGTLLPELTEAQQWRATGMQRLYNQMSEEVYPDGLENELALGYGLWVLRNYANIYDLWVLNDRQDEVPADYKSLLERMYNYLLYARSPDGRVPGLNDSGHAAAQSYLAKGYEYFPARQDFRWGATLGAEGSPPDQTSYAFDYSGHYVMRSGWDADARFLLLDAGPWGSGHQHEDKLTFDMVAHDHWWIVEGGSYMYDKSRWRRYVLSTRGHNTVRVDGQDQNRRRVRDTWVLRPPFEPLGNPWVSNEAFDYVSGVYESGYGPAGDIRVRHQREVLFVKPDYWVIVDTLEPEDDAEHEYETIFHMRAEEASAQGTHVRASFDSKGLTLAGWGGGLSVDIVEGLTEEPVQGWANYPWGPVPTALFTNRAAGTVRNAYVLYPSESAEVAPSVETVATAQGNALCLRIGLPGGETDYFAKLGAREEPLKLGPISTDADVALVRTGKDGEVIGVSTVGGTCLAFDDEAHSVGD